MRVRDTVLCVPSLITQCPWQWRAEGVEGVDEGPGYKHGVVPAGEQTDHVHGHTNTCEVNTK